MRAKLAIVGVVVSVLSCGRAVRPSGPSKPASPLEVRRALRSAPPAIAAASANQRSRLFPDSVPASTFGPSPVSNVPSLEIPEHKPRRSTIFERLSLITPTPDRSGRFEIRRPGSSVLFKSRGFALALGDGPRKRGLQATLIGARDVQPIAERQQPTLVNRYVGAPSQWQTAMPAYGQLAWEEIYSGVDMVIEPERDGFAYHFVLSPGARVADVTMHWEGANAIRVTEEGRGVDIGTDVGVLHVRGLRAFAIDGAERFELPTRFAARDGNVVHIEVDGWSGREVLVIDPTVAWESSFGGSATESPSAIAVDAAGDALIAGWTESADFPTSGGFDSTLAVKREGFIAKVSSGGALLWSSYLGDMSPYGVAVDGNGNAFVAGTTLAADLPTSGGFDTTYGGNIDAFVAKISGTGALLWSSYVGGSSDDQSTGVAVDGNGDAFVTGSTSSSDFPVSTGVDNTLGGSRDAFVTKVSGTGALLWSSFVGGSQADFGYGVAVDGSGNVLVVGGVSSPDFATSDGRAGSLFLAKFSSAGPALWSTRFGGTGGGHASAIAVDPSGAAFVTGTTHSADFPTVGGFDTTFGSACPRREPCNDAFVVKVSSAGALVWGSYLGGENDDVATGIAVDRCGNAFVTGYTLSADFPAKNGLGAEFTGELDGFVTKVSGSGALLWSSWLGEIGLYAGVAADRSGNALVTHAAATPDRTIFVSKINHDYESDTVCTVARTDSDGDGSCSCESTPHAGGRSAAFFLAALVGALARHRSKSGARRTRSNS